MSLADAHTPRLFLVRHGETTWSKSGRYTGITDLPLLPEGESRIRSTASLIYGPGRLIDPTKLTKVYVSPRLRAQQTWKLYEATGTGTAAAASNNSPKSNEAEHISTTTEDRIREWGYGDYEGLFTSEIRALRQQRGHDQTSPWDIWRDGTEGPGGEDPASVAARLDALIGEISSLQGAAMQQKSNKGDVVVVAHGHILRAFVKRWLGLELASGLNLMLEPGGVCGLSYSHGRIEERAVLVGMSFPGGER